MSKTPATRPVSQSASGGADQLNYNLGNPAPKPKSGKSSFWIILIILFVFLIGVIIFSVFWRTRTGQDNITAPGQEPTQQRSDEVIISELEGVSLVIDSYYQENGAYPIKVVAVELIDMKSEISGLEGYNDDQLKSFGGKDFLYQSDEAGSKCIFFAVLSKDSPYAQANSPTGFPFPGGYNYYLSNK